MVNHFKNKLNKIDNSIKEHFSGIKYTNTIFNKVDILVDKPLHIDDYGALIKIHINEQDLYNESNTVNCEYLINPEKKDSKVITFKSNINNIGNIAKEIYEKKKFDLEYLNLLKSNRVENINEEIEVDLPDEAEVSFESTFNVLEKNSENNSNDFDIVIIEKNNLEKFLKEKFNLDGVEILLEKPNKPFDSEYVKGVHTLIIKYKMTNSLVLSLDKYFKTVPYAELSDAKSDSYEITFDECAVKLV